MFGSTGWLTAIVAASGAALSIMFGAIGSAGAQEPARGETVTDRARPELDPLGARMGGFLFYPQLGIAGQYDDNVFSTDAGELDDTITIVSPGLQLRSDWNNHALNLFATGDIGRYADFDTENYNDYSVGFDGRVDVSRDSVLSLGVSFARLHEARGSVDAGLGAEPNEFTVLAPEILFSQSFGRISLQAGTGLRRFDFDDSSVENHDDRDRDEWESTLRLGYEIVPGYEAFVRGTYIDRAYEDTLDDNGIQRSSNGTDVVAGTAIDFTGVTTGEIFVGYRSQSLDDAAFDTIKGAQYGGEIVWNASGLTTLKAFVERTIEETTLNNASGFFATGVGGSVDHELLRNLLLGADVSFTGKKYEGTAITRDDNDVEVGLSAKYLLNRNFYVTGSYDFTRRSSSELNEDFAKNVYFLQLQTQY